MSEKPEIWFYHLERSTLDQVLPTLLERLSVPVVEEGAALSLSISADGRTLTTSLPDERVRTALADARSSEITWFMCRLKSSTMPGPTALPAQDVPAPRGVIGTPSMRATARVSSTSSVLRGRTIARGSTR